MIIMLALCSPQPGLSLCSKEEYSGVLAGQVQERQGLLAEGREIDDMQQRQHFQSWQTFWGRPGCGAPRDTINKENLLAMLHYPSTVCSIN